MAVTCGSCFPYGGVVVPSTQRWDLGCDRPSHVMSCLILVNLLTWGSVGPALEMERIRGYGLRTLRVLKNRI